ncbi:MAG: nucleotidyltransferase domain-containing protein [Candidatus Woesearchaeota archaeon]
MDFAVHKKVPRSKGAYSATNLELAYSFSKEIHKELNELLKAIVLFGSAARQKEGAHDIDILLIVDDVSIRLTPELTQAYRIIVEKTVQKISPKIHVTSMKFTSFWEYVKAGDPIAVNILRDGYAILDTGFFDPMQALLVQGRIKPSLETMWAYYNRAPRTLIFSKKRILDATVDLYWAIIDSAHAALMSINEVPPSPEHVADLLEQKLVNTKKIDKKYPWTMRKFYALSKKIAIGQITEIQGAEYDKLHAEATAFVNAMEKFIKSL